MGFQLGPWIVFSTLRLPGGGGSTSQLTSEELSFWHNRSNCRVHGVDWNGAPSVWTWHYEMGVDQPVSRSADLFFSVSKPPMPFGIGLQPMVWWPLPQNYLRWMPQDRSFLLMRAFKLGRRAGHVTKGQLGGSLLALQSVQGKHLKTEWPEWLKIRDPRDPGIPTKIRQDIIPMAQWNRKILGLPKNFETPMGGPSWSVFLRFNILAGLTRSPWWQNFEWIYSEIVVPKGNSKWKVSNFFHELSMNFDEFCRWAWSCRCLTEVIMSQVRWQSSPKGW